MDDYAFDYVINLAAETEYGQSDEVITFVSTFSFLELRTHLRPGMEKVLIFHSNASFKCFKTLNLKLEIDTETNWVQKMGGISAIFSRF